MLIADKTLKDTINHITAEFCRNAKDGREQAYQYAKAQLFGISKLLIGRKEHAYTEQALKHLDQINSKLMQTRLPTQAA